MAASTASTLSPEIEASFFASTGSFSRRRMASMSAASLLSSIRRFSSRCGRPGPDPDVPEQPVLEYQYSPLLHELKDREKGADDVQDGPALHDVRKEELLIRL